MFAKVGVDEEKMVAPGNHVIIDEAFPCFLIGQDCPHMLSDFSGDVLQLSSPLSH